MINKPVKIGKLKFVDTSFAGAESYSVFTKGGDRIYVIRRSPLLWQAFDKEGDAVSEPFQSRYDLFEQLAHNYK